MLSSDRSSYNPIGYHHHELLPLGRAAALPFFFACYVDPEGQIG